MSIRSLAAAAASTVLGSLLLAAPVAAKTATAELRVLTPTQVIDPGTRYVVGPSEVPTSPEADCLGPPGGSGARYSFEKPVALGLLANAARANRDLKPLLVSDQFGFGLLVCGIGGALAEQGESFWYLKRNHEEATTGADQIEVADGDEVLFYLAPDDYPNPNPKELELEAPARAETGQPFSVRVLEHGCVTDPDTFEVRCETLPAAGATIGGGPQPATTGADGTATLTPETAGRLKLTATRGADIPSKTLRVCAAAELSECPAARGERIIGSSEGDRITGSAGPDALRGRGGKDLIDIRSGGRDKVDCGGGRDRVLRKRSDRDDAIANDCERVGRK